MTHRSRRFKKSTTHPFSFVPCLTSVLHWIELNLCVHRSLRCSLQGSCNCLTGWLDPLSPRPSFSENCPFLVMPWRGILCPRATPFLSFLSLANLLKKVNFSTPLPLVWNECSTVLARLFSSKKPEFSSICSLCSLSSFSPSASLGHHLTHSTFSDGVSSKEIYNSAPGRITPLSASKPVPRVNKRVFV